MVLPSIETFRDYFEKTKIDLPFVDIVKAQYEEWFEFNRQGKMVQYKGMRNKDSYQPYGLYLEYETDFVKIGCRIDMSSVGL